MRRREFIATLASPPAIVGQARKRPPLCIFSKHMARYGWDELGAKAKELGFDGVDLTVRPKGHVLPERVSEDLPRAVEAIRRRGLDVPMVTTDLKDATDPAARATFAAMRKLGIQLYKPGYWRYGPAPRVAAAAAECRKKLEGLVALGREDGVTAGLHNHSGPYFGCAVWDYREILRGVKAEEAGFYFDPGHAVIEGGLFNWRVSLDVALERMKMSAIKDFSWEKSEGQWRTRWRPLGEGMTPWGEVFAAYAQAGFTGPLSLHLEYPGGEELEAIRKDLEFLKRQVAGAYVSWRATAGRPFLKPVILPAGRARPRGASQWGLR